jgi:5'-nucleotidase
VHILVTNDDGVHAPGLAALAQALARWMDQGSEQGDRAVTVVAPLTNHSGAGAAVGTVFERDAIAYREARIPGAESVPSYGVDASPALAVILGVLGAFGPPPDAVLSGINLGVNIGRSILHSGTVGAVLTGAQLGVKGLAVSMRSDGERHHFETAADLAVAMLDVLTDAPARTVLNLNVPSRPIDDLRGVRHGALSTAAMIRGVTREEDPRSSDGSVDGVRPEIASTSTALREGRIVLQLGTAIPSLGDVTDEAPDDDGALVAAGYASITALVGVREDQAERSRALLSRAAEVGRALLAGRD